MDKLKEFFKDPKRQLIAQMLLLLGVVYILAQYYFAVIDFELIGFIHDDGVYAVLGKALSEGKGFHLIHHVTEPGQVKYPVLYPLILAVGWLINPSFPQNLPLLSYITVSFAFLFMICLYFYYQWVHQLRWWLCILLLVLVCFNYFTVYFSTAIMSEAPYFLFSLLLVFFAEKVLPREKLEPWHWGVLLLLSALTFHARVLGLCAITAVGLWMLANKQFKRAFIYGAAAGSLTIIPWILWLKANFPSEINDLNFPILHAYSNYVFEFASNYKTNNVDTLLFGSLGSFVDAFIDTLFPFVANSHMFFKVAEDDRVLGWMVFLADFLGTYILVGYYLLRGVQASRKWEFSVGALYVFVYILVIVLWHYEEQMHRFSAAILPWLWLYIFKPFNTVFDKEVPLRSIKIGAMVVLITLATFAFDSGYRFIMKARKQHWIDVGQHRYLWAEFQATFGFIRDKLPPGASVATAWDTAYYLYTGHPTYYLYFASLRKEDGEYTEKSYDALYRSMKHHKVDYVVLEPQFQNHQLTAPYSAVAYGLIKRHKEDFDLVYTSPREVNRVFKFNYGGDSDTSEE